MAAVPTDDDAVYEFERHRLGGGGEPITAFLPPAADPRYRAILEELICIDLECRFKQSSPGAPPPTLEPYAGLLDLEDVAELRTRIEHEVQLLAERFLSEQQGAGTVMGRYRLEAIAGRGAFSTVWRAYDETLGRRVALKIPRTDLGGNEQALARLEREARSAAQLRHRSIVTVHEVGRHEGEPFIVSEFVAGPTLREALAEQPYTFDEAADFVAQLAGAVHYAHTCGVVHRDVKPGNVLLPERSHPMLTDFGLATLDSAEHDLTREGEVLGTPGYMAPEQARGDNQAVGPHTDVHALGVILYELITARAPFRRDTTAATLHAVLHTDPPRPSTVRVGVPIDLETICLHAMAKEPSRRYPSAAEFEADLRRYLARKPILTRPSSKLTRLGLWIRRNPALAGSVAAGLATVLVVAAVGLLGVLRERNRYREQRDETSATLYHSLVSEAQLRWRSRPPGWYEAALENVRLAAGLDTPARDLLKLRSLALRLHAVREPSFQHVSTWEEKEAAVRRMAIDSSGRWLAEATRSGTLQVRDARSGAVRWSQEGATRCLVWHPKDALLFTGSKDGVVRCLSLDGGIVDTFESSDAQVHAVAISRSGHQLAVARSTAQVELLAIDQGRLRTLRALPGHEGGALALAFSPTDARLVSGGRDGRALLHQTDEETAAPIVLLEADDPVRRVSIGQRGLAVSVSTNECFGFLRVLLASPDRLPLRAILKHGSSVTGVHDLADQVLTVSLDGSLRVTSAHGEPLALALPGLGGVRASALSGDYLVVAHSDGRHSTWRYARPPGTELLGNTHGLAFLEDPHLLAAGTHLRKLHETGGAPAVRYLSYPRQQVWGVATGRADNLIATSDHRGAVRLWRSPSGKRVRTLREEDGSIAWVVAFDPQHPRVAAGVNLDIELLDLEGVNPPVVLKGHTALVVGLAFHPTQEVLVSTAREGGPRIWNSASGAYLGELPWDGEELHSIRFSPDGSQLAAACHDGRVVIWDDPSPSKHPTRSVGDAGSPNWAVAYSPDGRLLASASQDGVVVLRDARSGDVLARLEGGSELARALDFSSDSRYLACGCYGKPGLAWDLRRLREILADLKINWRD